MREYLYYRSFCAYVAICIILFCFTPNLSFSQPEKKVDLLIRYGQGGFPDERSEIGKLGGGQLAFTIKPHKYPLGFTLSGEYYTNSAQPTQPFEISDMTVMNISYMDKLFQKERIDFFAGIGTGWLKVPDGVDGSQKALLGNFEAGINFRVIWKIGIYGVYKYLYARKDIIDFDEHIGMFGISLKFSL